MKKEIHKISKAFKDKKVLLTDCFDTLVYRTCQPKDVIYRWLDCIARDYEMNYDLVRETWCQLMKWQRNKKKDVEEYPFFKLCYEFYLRLTYLENKVNSFENFYNNILRKMEEIEMNVLLVNPEIFDVIKTAKEAGLKVYCVSDFYLPKVTLEAFFKKLNIDSFIDDIFVSSEVGRRKSSGTLYHYVLECIGCSHDEVIMVGDNRYSDYKIPMKLGIQAFCYNMKMKGEIATIDFVKDLYSENVKEGLPFANYSFSMYLFCERLRKKLIDNKFEEVYFFSREGEYLKKAFDVYLGIIGEKRIRTQYLYVSRQSTYLPSLKALNEEHFEGIRKQFKCLSLKSFLKSINIENAILTDTKLGERYDLDKNISNFFESTIFNEFCNEKTFQKIYEEERVKAKEEALMYFRTMGISKEQEKIAIVDIGWKGSIQDNLFGILDEKCDITGYYYGLLGDVKLTEKCKKIGLIFSDIPYKSIYYDIYSVNYRMLERVLYASHGSCLRYKNAEAVLDDVEKDECELYDFTKIIQNKMLLNIKEIANFVQDNWIARNEIDEAIKNAHIHFILDITKQRVKQMEYMDYRQKMNFGDWGVKESRKNIILTHIKRIKYMSKVERFNKVLIALAKTQNWILLGIIRKIAIKICT